MRSARCPGWRRSVSHVSADSFVGPVYQAHTQRDMSGQLREQLWTALSAKAAEIIAGFDDPAGHRREPLYLCADGHAAMVILHIWHRDDSTTIFRLKASRYPNRDLTVAVDVWTGPDGERPRLLRRDSVSDDAEAALRAAEAVHHAA